MNRKIAIFSIITVLGVLIDQVSKYWVRASEAVNSPGGVPVIPHFFSFVHAENPGAALGMLGGIDETWRVLIFVVFTIIACIIVWDLFRRLPPTDIFLSTTLALILSGALGNIIDRVTKPMWGDSPTVTDFLHVYTDDPGIVSMIKGWFESGLLYEMFGNVFENAGSTIAYPTFNIADINLVVGVGLFLVHYLFIESRKSDDDEDLDDEDLDDEDLDDEDAEADTDADAETDEAAAGA